MTINVLRPFKQVFAGRFAMLSVFIGALITFAAALAQQFGVIGALVAAVLSTVTVGYAVTLMGNETKANANFVPALPAWHINLLDLVRRGLSISFAVFIYFAGVRLFVGLTHEVVNHVADATAAQGGLLTFLALIYNGVSIVTTLSLAVFVPMLTAHYSSEDSLRSLIDVRTVFARVFANKLNTVLALVVSVVVLVLSDLISQIPLGGFAFAQFLMLVVLGSLWAQTYRLAR
jgi:hypothetical protein